jgi:phage-related protein
MDQGRTKRIREIPARSQIDLSCCLTIAAEGGKADIVKPVRGMGSGLFEVALRYSGDAFRVVYGVQFGAEIWVIHAFQKKSTQGVNTPQREVDLIRERLKRLKEMLR